MSDQERTVQRAELVDPRWARWDAPDLPPDPSWDELAARAGIDAPRLAPGEHPMCLTLDMALYWPVVPPELQEARG